MEALTKVVRKKKRRSTIVLTILYCLPFLLVWYITRPDLSVNDAIIFFIGWYIIAVAWVWDEVNPDEEIQELLFPAGYYEEIHHLVMDQKFILYIDKKDSISFRRGTGRFQKDKIKISRKRNHIWKIRGKAKYLKCMEDYRVHYNHRMMPV